MTTVSDLFRRVLRHRDFGWSVASSYVHTLINIIVQVLLIPLYLQYLGKAQFGVLMIVLASINYLGLGITWASAGAQRFMGECYAQEDMSGFARVLGLSKIIYLGYALLTSGAAYLLIKNFGDQWFSDSPNLIADIMQMLLFGIVYMVVLYDLNTDRLALIAIGKQAFAHLLSIISLVVFALAVIPVLAQGHGLPGVMGANVLGVVLARVCSLIFLRRQSIQVRWPQTNERMVLKQLIGPMGLGYAAYGALLLTLLQADTLLLGALGGAVLVADFVLIWKVADVAMQALWRLPETLVPYLVQMDVKNERDRMRSIYFTGRKAMLVLATLVGVGYALLGPYAVELWVGSENAPDMPWAYALAGSTLFWMVIARLPAVYAFALVRLRPLVQVISIEVILKVLVVLVLFPFIGLYAPLIAVNVVHIFGVAYLYQQLFRKCDV